MKFLTDGDQVRCLLVRDPFFYKLENGGAGETPAPTVKVWMGEVFVEIRMMPIKYFSLLKIERGNVDD